LAPALTARLAAVCLRSWGRNVRERLVGLLALLHSRTEVSVPVVAAAQHGATHTGEHQIVAALADHQRGQLVGQGCREAGGFVSERNQHHGANYRTAQRIVEAAAERRQRQLVAVG
jgi:hypothetical protein